MAVPKEQTTFGQERPPEKLGQARARQARKEERSQALWRSPFPPVQFDQGQSPVMPYALAGRFDADLSEQKAKVGGVVTYEGCALLV
jgi:hypothetical protein